MSWRNSCEDLSVTFLYTLSGCSDLIYNPLAEKKPAKTSPAWRGASKGSCNKQGYDRPLRHSTSAIRLSQEFFVAWTRFASVGIGRHGRSRSMIRGAPHLTTSWQRCGARGRWELEVGWDGMRKGDLGTPFCLSIE